MIRSLLLLNGLAAVGAVVIHATGWGFTALFWWTNRYDSVRVPDFSRMGSGDYWILRVVEQLVSAGVPAFLFVSGVFVAFAAGREKRMAWDKTVARVRMLLIPYVIWSLAIFAGRMLEGRIDTPVGYLEQLLFGRAAMPYYYVPLVVQLYLISPLLVRWLERRWTAALVVTAVVQIVIQASRYPVLLGWDAPAAAWLWRHTPAWFFPQAVFWFLLGIAAGVHRRSFQEWLQARRTWLAAAAFGLGIAGVAEWELLTRLSAQPWLNPTQTVVDSLFAAAMLLAFVAFAQQAPRLSRREVEWLGERSYGVYLIHAPVLELTARLVYHVSPTVLAHQWLFQPLLVAAGLGVPLLVMTAVRSSRVRPTYNYLFG